MPSWASVAPDHGHRAVRQEEQGQVKAQLEAQTATVPKRGPALGFGPALFTSQGHCDVQDKA